MLEISKKCKVSTKTVQNINIGQTHYDESVKYPIRVTGQMIGKLRQRLSKPNKNAVPNPHILSPQLLDYIGFLSILGADLYSIIEFKEVYYKPLKDFFQRELTNEEILAIIELRPQRPTQLKEIIEAYYSPKVKLINLDYWVKTGFIKKGERDMIYSLLIKG